MKKERVLVKVVQLHTGVDLVGSRMSFASKKGTELEMTPIGIKMHSASTNRTIVIPYSNVKGFELFASEE